MICFPLCVSEDLPKLSKSTKHWNPLKRDCFTVHWSNQNKDRDIACPSLGEFVIPTSKKDPRNLAWKSLLLLLESPRNSSQRPNTAIQSLLRMLPVVCAHRVAARVRCPACLRCGQRGKLRRLLEAGPWPEECARRQKRIFTNNNSNQRPS